MPTPASSPASEAPWSDEEEFDDEAYYELATPVEHRPPLPAWLQRITTGPPRDNLRVSDCGWYTGADAERRPLLTGASAAALTQQRRAQREERRKLELKWRRVTGCACFCIVALVLATWFWALFLFLFHPFTGLITDVSISRLPPRRNWRNQSFSIRTSLFVENPNWLPVYYSVDLKFTFLDTGNNGVDWQDCQCHCVPEGCNGGIDPSCVRQCNDMSPVMWVSEAANWEDKAPARWSGPLVRELTCKLGRVERYPVYLMQTLDSTCIAVVAHGTMTYHIRPLPDKVYGSIHLRLRQQMFGLGQCHKCS
eukprot:TRINITY_DN11447_c0_g1_i1.p1 TRINITY_DN11447_c0_g1~~TRINITY_DN11447_c0_g1_i1.p1  ORF type:complete len:309 (+),score=97.08 TRINITY_DN11447_c0_g1_i1:169-1095(+)